MTVAQASTAHAQREASALVEPLDPQPIILLGAHRSGTTMLGGFFSRVPGVAYFEEPRHIWTWGNAYTEDDRLDASHARPEVVNHIRRRFNAFMRKGKGSRFCEKTPSNCLRVPFVLTVYPQARLIHILRDGRAVVRSTVEILHRHAPLWRIAERALKTSPREWLAYAPRAVRQISRKLARRPMEFWGPRPPGWRQWVGRDPQHVMVARQWAGCALEAARTGRALSAEQYLEVRYEDLMQRPRETLATLFEFARLSAPASLLDELASEVDPTRQDAWREAFTEEQLAQMRPILEPALTELGYAW